VSLKLAHPVYDSLISLISCRSYVETLTSLNRFVSRLSITLTINRSEFAIRGVVIRADVFTLLDLIRNSHQQYNIGFPMEPNVVACGAFQTNWW